MKPIAFLSFSHWTASPQSGTRSASDALVQSIALAVAAEALGADGAYVQAHHSRGSRVRRFRRWRRAPRRTTSDRSL